MPAHANAPVADTFARDSRDPSVLVADGYGLSLHVHRGQLHIRDGIGQHRRERHLSRAQRTVRRLVLLGHTGTISLDAIRWCTDIGIALVQLDTDGRVLMLANHPSRTDPRLLRAQAAAPSSDVGVAIARHLLAGKLDGHARVLDELLYQPQLGTVVRDVGDQLSKAATLPACRDLESQAANVYFSAWPGRVHCQFSEQHQTKVPEHWQRYTVRRSPLHRGATSRNAADPVNATLNYGYALAESEARLAALTMGLDPGLGILHTDQKTRDSLALDLLEPLRPVVERYVLAMLTSRRFHADDFAENRTGVCRLLAPLTHDLAEALLPELARAVARPTEAVAHLLAGSSPNAIQLRTPLSRSNTTHAQQPGRRSENKAATAPAVKQRPTCQKCGVDLYGSARKLCPVCWPITRNEYMRQLGRARSGGPTPDALDLKTPTGWSLEGFQREILPLLATYSLADIEKATGLSNATASRLKRGLQVPNPRHWAALATLVGRPS